MNLLQRLGRGLEAGTLAGIGVTVLFLATDVVGLAPLRTVRELADPLFGGAAPVWGDSWVGFASAVAAVALYTLLHFATFAILGVVSSWVIPTASFWGTLARGAGFGAVVCSAVFLAGRGLTGSPFFAEGVGPVGLLLTNATAGVIMAAVFAVHVADEEGTGPVA